MGAEQGPQGPTLEQLGWKIDANGQLVVAATGKVIHLTDAQKALMVDVQAQIDASVSERARQIVIRGVAMDVLAADVDLGKLDVRGADYEGVVRVSLREMHELMILAIEADRKERQSAVPDAIDKTVTDLAIVLPSSSQDVRLLLGYLANELFGPGTAESYS
jgi:hypothetical protein